MKTRTLDIILCVLTTVAGIYFLFTTPADFTTAGVFAGMLRYFRPLAFLAVGLSFFLKLSDRKDFNAFSSKLSNAGILLYIIYLLMSVTG